MDLEAGFISSIQSKEDLLSAIDSGINKDFFHQHGDIYQAILDHYGRYKTVPGQEIIHNLFPNFHFEKVDQPVEYFVDSLKLRQKKQLLKEAILSAGEALKSSPDEAEKALTKAVMEVKRQIVSAVDVDIRQKIDTRKDDYYYRKANRGIDGFESGWEFLDDKTLGYHPGDLVTFIAEPKRGKTWLLLWQARHIWKEEKVPVLFLTREMHPQSIQKRFDAIDCGLPYDDLRKGMLSDIDERKYFEYLDKMNEEEVPFVILGYSLNDTGATVSSLIPKVERYLMNGGVLFVDGIYLMEDDRGETDWRGIVNIAKDLKNMAQMYKIPIISSSQAQIQGKSYVPNIENIAYGKYIAQYVDALLSISQTDNDRIAEQSWIHLIAQREGDLGSFAVRAQFQPHIDFSQKPFLVLESEEEEDMDIW